MKQGHILVPFLVNLHLNDILNLEIRLQAISLPPYKFQIAVCASNKLYVFGLLLLFSLFTVVVASGDFSPASLWFPLIFRHF